MTTPSSSSAASPAPSPAASPAGSPAASPDEIRTASPMISVAAVALVMVMAALYGLARYREVDVWWHLYVGDFIRDTHQLTFWDPAAPFANHAYVATQWLPEVVASALVSTFGMGAITWLRAVFLVALELAIYISCRRYAGRLTSAAVAGLALLASGGGLNPRPQLVSFVLFALTLHAWLGMARDHRPRWWLVAVFWVWGCSHGLWAFGLALGGVMLVSLVADPLARPPRDQSRRLVALWASCVMVLALTPLGPKLLATPFTVATQATLIADEWRPTPLNNIFAWSLLLELVLITLLWARRPARRQVWQLALLVFATACGLWMWRLVPLGAIAAAPLAAGAIQEHLSTRREAFAQRERRLLVVGALVLVLMSAVVAAGPRGTSAQAYPGRVTMVDAALDKLPAGTVVLDDFGISGYLIHEHPTLRPVADLRGELFSRDHLLGYRDALAGKPGWEDFVRSSGAQAALLEVESAPADALEHTLGWTRLATAGGLVLLEQPSP